MSNICVTGSRHWHDVDLISAVLALYLHPNLAAQNVLHVGDARGADAIAREVSWAFEREPVVYEAFWDAQGKSAGPRRNIRMLNTAKPIVLLAFRLRNSPTGSRGTDQCVLEARKRGIPVITIETDLTEQQLSLL
jgi:hypothetical protein